LSKQNSSLVGAATDKGPMRPVNEDTYLLPGSGAHSELGAIYIVADGVGGQAHGADAAQLAAQVAHDTFYHARRLGHEALVALEDALNQANDAVYKEGQQRGEKMGCTLVAAVQHDGQLFIAHVGDARAYLLQNGRLRRLTRDDTWVQRQVEAGVITAAQAAQHELRNVVTQVLGNRPTVTVNLAQPRPFLAGETLLLCSDGLYDALPEKRLIQLLMAAPPPVAADTLVQAAADAGTSDNITAVVVNGNQRPVGTALPRRRAGRPLPLWLLALPVGLLLAAVLFLIFRSPAVSGNPADMPTRDLVADTPAAPTSAATATFAPTSTVRPTDAPTATPALGAVTAAPAVTAAATSTATPSPTAVLSGCVSYQVFVWRDDQIASQACNQFAGQDFVLAAGELVQILVGEPQSANGPDASCQPGEFIKVQSAANPAIEGWVFSNAIRLLAPGEQCQ
jgi:PPM family protein phosphatase